MFKYCLFDLDGTLTDPKEGITKSVQYALRFFGINEEDRDRLTPFIGPPLKDSFMEIYGFSESESIAAVEKYRERFADVGVFENKILPGTEKMLRTLHENGKKLAVASSKPIGFVRQILEHFAILKYFDVVVGSELNGDRTAKEEVVEEALRQLKEKAGADSDSDIHDTCVMIGDRRFDIEGAKAHGITGVGVRFGYAGKDELEKAGADFIVETMEELTELLLLESSKAGQ